MTIYIFFFRVKIHHCIPIHLRYYPKQYFMYYNFSKVVSQSRRSKQKATCFCTPTPKCVRSASCRCLCMVWTEAAVADLKGTQCEQCESRRRFRSGSIFCFDVFSRYCRTLVEILTFDMWGKSKWLIFKIDNCVPRI